VTTVVITGCNRGIGLELCKQYTARGDTVIAVCRQPSDELRQTGAEIVEGVDVSDDSATARLQEALGDRHIDVLVNNAGILFRDTLDDVDYEEMVQQYRVNTVGPLRVTRALLGNLGKGSKIGIVTSRVGSVEDNESGAYYGYRSSKAAANMVGMSLHRDLADRGIHVMLLHPGYVATDMTGGQGVSAVDSAAGLIARLDELGPETSGTFWHAEGYALPW
jgi:NAD(P)-dependent dehydrogenase (short-subunit alcohol dehydrogenase family)